ncbi:MAG: DnaD domain protein [Lachnospiraceae bacterium]|nr:DnaD domain protein [Lachnospiraceae bacterium]
MQSVRLSDSRSLTATLLPDSFIEEVMPRANGDFVKIYIYLLSTHHHPERELSLSSIADVFSCTEKDVLRALIYWSNEGYLSMEMEGDRPVSLTFCDPARPSANKKPETTAAVSPTPETTEAKGEAKEDVSISLSADRIRTLKAENAEVQQILYVAESYLNRTLSRSDITCILYFYDTLHMSADLLEYLIEYCVLHQKTSIHYIQKVGLEWHRAGYTTVKEAKEGSSSLRKEYFSILKAFGISNRRPIPAEIEYMDRWMNTYAFELPIITEACKRTVTNTGGSSFAYAEGILSNWKKQNVHTLRDIQQEDSRHQAEKKKKSFADKEAGKQPAPNRFHNFHQRDDYDYDQLEKDLLNKQW